MRSRERSGLQRIKCRACLKEIYWQNYKDHLRTKHQQEDCNDVRVHGQSSLFAFSTLKRKKPSDGLENLEKTTKQGEGLEGSEEIAMMGSEMNINMEGGKGDLTDSEENLEEDKVDEGPEEVPKERVEVTLEQDLEDKEDRMEMEQVDVKAINEVLLHTQVNNLN